MNVRVRASLYGIDDGAQGANGIRPLSSGASRLIVAIISNRDYCRQDYSHQSLCMELHETAIMITLIMIALHQCTSSSTNTQRTDGWHQAQDGQPTCQCASKRHARGAVRSDVHPNDKRGDAGL